MNTEKMGTPANGFRKPFNPPERRQMSVREAVKRWGDEWRLMLDADNPHKNDLSRYTQDTLEAIDMRHMERGLKRRVEL